MDNLPSLGDTIEITGVMSDPDPLPVGLRGTVISANAMQIGVEWANGRTLMLVPDDPYRIVRSA